MAFGFTLIELLVVVAIIALLISILLPSLSAARQGAKAVACAANTNHVGKAAAMYQGDNNGTFPPSYVYPKDESGSWDRRQDLMYGENKPFGYLHWSFLLYGMGEADEKAFQCPGRSGRRPAGDQSRSRRRVLPESQHGDLLGRRPAGRSRQGSGQRDDQGLPGPRGLPTSETPL